MKKSTPVKKEVDKISEKLVKISLYTLFLTPVYAMLFGFKMSKMLSAGEEIPELIKAAHTHSLLIAVLLLFFIYDWRLRDLESKERFGRKPSAIMLALSVAGLVTLTAGFSIAGLYPQETALGLNLANSGEIIMFLAVLAYILITIIEEMYK